MTRRPAVTPEDRLARIVEDGLCTGCGLCQAVAGPERVRMERVRSSHERPLAVGPLTHEIVDRIADVCPGLRLEGLPERLVAPDTTVDPVWGPVRRVVRAHASDPGTRHIASTGGVLTALGQYLLASGRAEFLLHAAPSTAHPTFGEARVSETPEAVLAGSGSRYGPTAPLIAVDQALGRGAPFAFIGKPCDVAALRNLARLDPRVDELVVAWLTMVCGGYMAPDAMDRYLREKEGVDPGQVVACRYRGYGCPGSTRFELDDGRVIERSYLDFWGEDESQWSLPFRCKICPDGIGEAADLAAADNWPNASPAPGETPETNVVVVRTLAGEALMREAEAAGYLTQLDEPDGRALDARHMDAVQPHQVAKKKAVRARWDGLAAEGRLTPRSARLRLDELSAAEGDAAYAREFDGARRRAREGKADEETPTRLSEGGWLGEGG